MKTVKHNTAAGRFWTFHRWISSSLGVFFLLTAMFAAFVGLVQERYAWTYVLMSLLAFIAYGLDKTAAESGRWRLSENTLHGLEVLCGWPGAFIAQHILRHKCRKGTFVLKTWLCGFANTSFLYVLLR